MMVMTIVLVLSLVLSGCTSPRASSAPPTHSSDQEVVQLPQAHRESDMSLEETLALRRSVRRFTNEELSIEEIAQLLWAAQGVTRDWGARTAPSAGALYPLEVYVATPQALLHYLPTGHQAQTLAEEDLRESVWRASLRQDAVRDAPAVFIIAAVYERTEGKYGQRATRYVHLEAGHAAQNILLQAIALGLSGVPIGAFHDQELQSVLSLPDDHEPLYVIPVGHPAE